MTGPWQPMTEVRVSLPEAPVASGLFSLSLHPEIVDTHWEAGYQYLPKLPGTTVRNRSTTDGGPGSIGDNVGIGASAEPITVKPWQLEVGEEISTLQMNSDVVTPDSARALLEFYTSMLLERELWTGEITLAEGSGNRYLADDDLLAEPAITTGVHNPQEAVATLVGRLAAAGMGQVMIHVPKRVGIMLPDGWRNEETLAEQGFVVVSGAGYPDGNRIYGTEVCNVRVSEIFMLGDPTRDNINTRTNTVSYNARRIGAVDFAGPVFACDITP
jgi:hypothetical protein